MGKKIDFNSHGTGKLTDMCRVSFPAGANVLGAMAEDNIRLGLLSYS